MLNTIYILVIFLVVLRILISIALIRTWQTHKQTALIWLAIHYFVFIVVDVLSNPAVFGNPVIASLQNFFSSLAYIPLSIFVWQTFYRERKVAPFIWIGLTVLLSIGGLIYSSLALNGSQSNLIIAYTFTGMLPLIVWGWHAWASIRAFGNIHRESLVEDWVKWRYQAMITYSIILFIGAIVGSLSPDPRFFETAVYTNFFLSTIAVILQYLTWVLPEPFRKWLNRNFLARLEKQQRERITSLLGILGNSISNETGISYMTAMMLLRREISRQTGVEDNEQVISTAVAFNYDNWLAILQSARLENDINLYTQKSSHSILQEAQAALAKNQSLLTLQATK